MENKFSVVVKKWNDILTGGENYNIQDTDIFKCIEENDRKAKEYIKIWNCSKDRSDLWDEFPLGETSDFLWKTYNRLRDLTIVYSTKGSELHNNDGLFTIITESLSWLYENHYYENAKEYANWWPWHIGVPLMLNDMLVLLSDKLDKELIGKYLRASEFFTPDPRFCRQYTVKATGANLLDTARVVAIRSALLQDEAGLVTSRDAISDVFNYVEEGDGFYVDGSFVQHGDIPYTCSYGMVLIDGIAVMMELLSETDWQIQDKSMNNVYNWIYNSYEPLIYKGAAMDMVRGRAVSRSYLQDHDCGHEIIGSIARIIRFATPYHANKLKGLVKYWLNTDTCGRILKHNSIHVIKTLKNILEDTSVDGLDEPCDSYIFAAMDRVVHRRPGFALGISMYSNRIQNYEDMNDENKKAWYTADGMTYIYNNNPHQFSDGFWPTVNPYRMAGTTVDTMERKIIMQGNTASIPYGQSRSNASWVGGASLANKYSACGMQIDSKLCTLKAKKSWFMFDNEIVALGSDINSTDKRMIETIVHNAKVNWNQSEIALNEEGVLPLKLNEKVKIENNRFIFIKGNVLESNIGYYFPQGTDINALWEEREGTWRDININCTDETIKRKYLSLWLEHGENVQGAGYAYVIVPNTSLEELRGYSEKQKIEILDNSDRLQAVKNNELNIIGANFWTDESCTSDIITCEQRASIVVQKENGFLSLAVSDPTMENNETINIELDAEVVGVIEKDIRITVHQIKPTIKLSAYVNGIKGKSLNIKFKLEM